MIATNPRRRRVVITGIGLVTPCGSGVSDVWDNIVCGRSCIGPITIFDASRCDTRFAGEVKDFDPTAYMERKQAKRMGRFQQFAMSAAELAMRDARLCIEPEQAHRAAAIIGSGVAGLNDASHEYDKVLKGGPGAVSPFFILQIIGNLAPAQIAIRYGFKGPNWGTNSACSTSAHAIGEGMRLIERDDADIVMAGGAEAPVSVMGVAGFNALRALSTRNDEPQRASRPFDAGRDGFVLGEGAAIVMLEELEHARARGATIYAELAGYAATADAHHLTAPGPGHEGGQRAMRLALRDAGLEPTDIDYINAHATSTPLGDTLEIEAIKAVFGDHAYKLAVSSTKSMTGHLLGAAGAAEAAFCALALQHSTIPPTINLDTADPAIDIDCVPHTSRVTPLHAVMSNSFGFGGTNVSLVLRAADPS